MGGDALADARLFQKNIRADDDIFLQLHGIHSLGTNLTICKFPKVENIVAI